MKCPKCGKRNTSVQNSRTAQHVKAGCERENVECADTHSRQWKDIA